MADTTREPNGNGTGQTQVTFARTLGLFDATMIGVGAMIGAGIFVLTGLAAREAGPAAILAFALNGIVTMFTALSYAELASAIPEAGGGYSYIKRAFPSWVGFLSGWMLWFAYTVACSLYALGFASYFWEFFHRYTPDLAERAKDVLTFWPNSHLAVVTLLIGATFIALNYRGAEVTGKTENIITVAKIVILAIFCAFGVWQALTHPDIVVAAFVPFFTNGAGGVIVAMGLTFIAFEGYDLIATVSEEVKDPEHNIPKAIFLSLGISITIYLLILFVSLGAVQGVDGMRSWQLLGEKGETAIVEAAKSFMPAFGVALIVFGGLLSTISALNATILASSRVAFTMGRDRLLPPVLATIHRVRRTPHIAIVVTGVILLALAVSFDVTVVGSAASVMFLLTFTLVNLSVLVLRNDRNIKRRYRIPFYPWPPLLGTVTSVFLAVYQLNLGAEGIRSWTVAIGWVVVGMAIYFAFFRKEAAKVEPQVLALPLERRKPAAATRFRVLVPVYNPDNVELLIRMACLLCKPYGNEAEVLAISVVNVPVQLDVQEGRKLASQREGVLAQARKTAAEYGIPCYSEVRIAHRTPQAILSMAQQEHVDVLILGWRGHTKTRDAQFGAVVDEIIDKTPCDLFVVRCDRDLQLPLENILLPTAGGPSANFAAGLAERLLTEDGRLVLAGVARPNASEESLTHVRQMVASTMGHISFGVEADRVLLVGDSVADAIIRETGEKAYGAVIVGATRTSWFKRVMFGQIPEQIARDSKLPVILVKHHEGAKTVASRYLGD